MGLNCKPGDLVILVACDDLVLKKYIGAIRTVKRPCAVYRGCWDLDPPLLDEIGKEASWADFQMRPLRDSDGTDEMICIAGLPNKEPSNV